MAIRQSKAGKAGELDWGRRSVCLHFLPPYSPELNLIEMLWRKVKCEGLPFDAYQSYSRLKKWVLEILNNVGEKFQVVG